LKVKVGNIYKRGCLSLKYPENLSEKISLKICCLVIEMLYNIYMEKGSIKSGVI
jgi:hypothetical protein